MSLRIPEESPKDALHRRSVIASMGSMWYSRLFWKLFLTYAGLVLLAVGACAAIVAGWQEQQHVDQARRRLRDSATLLRDQVGNQLDAGSTPTLQQHVRQLGAQTQTRFTLVDDQGRVLADSEQPTLDEVAKMENHLGRKEFVQAAREGVGLSRRRSPTLGVPFLYYAMAVERDGATIGFVRAAQPIASIQEEVSSIHWQIAYVGLLIGLVGLVVTYWITRRITYPIRRLASAAEAIAQGDYPQQISVGSNDEFGSLARSFEHMSAELRFREKQLRLSAERQTAVLSGMIDGVLAVDAQQRLLFANVAAGKKLSFAPDEIEGRALMEVVRSHELREIVAQALATCQLCQGEFDWQDTATLNLEVYATPLPGEPCPGVVLVLHDVTELRRLEGLRQQLVANVSHELKTPLSSIKAYTETLLRGALEDSDNARRFLSRIDDQTDRLGELIADMLSIARIESGEATLDIVDLPLTRVVDSVLSEQQSRAEVAKVSFINEIGANKVKVRADEESLRQILMNLIDNALKYTSEGGSITLRYHQDENDAVVEVADTGVGIAAEHHDRLFERFYRVDKARSRQLGGTGLGLAIVKHLCQAMEGNVSVESRPGEGSVFRVWLPLADRAEG